MPTCSSQALARLLATALLLLLGVAAAPQAGKRGPGGRLTLDPDGTRRGPPPPDDDGFEGPGLSDSVPHVHAGRRGGQPPPTARRRVPAGQASVDAAGGATPLGGHGSVPGGRHPSFHGVHADEDDDEDLGGGGGTFSAPFAKDPLPPVARRRAGVPAPQPGQAPPRHLANDDDAGDTSSIDPPPQPPKRVPRRPPPRRSGQYHPPAAAPAEGPSLHPGRQGGNGGGAGGGGRQWPPLHPEPAEHPPHPDGPHPRLGRDGAPMQGGGGRHPPHHHPPPQGRHAAHGGPRPGEQHGDVDSEEQDAGVDGIEALPPDHPHRLARQRGPGGGMGGGAPSPRSGGVPGGAGRDDLHPPQLVDGEIFEPELGPQSGTAYRGPSDSLRATDDKSRFKQRKAALAAYLAAAATPQGKRLGAAYQLQPHISQPLEPGHPPVSGHTGPTARYWQHVAAHWDTSGFDNGTFAFPPSSADVVHGVVWGPADQLRIARVYQCPMGDCVLHFVKATTRGGAGGGGSKGSGGRRVADRPTDAIFTRQNGSFPAFFYGATMASDLLPEPKHPRDVWGLYTDESPLNWPSLTSPDFMHWFDLLFVGSEAADATTGIGDLPYLHWLWERRPQPLRVKGRADAAPTLYLQSHQNVPSKRDDYVRALMKHTKIDACGSSLRNKEPPKWLPRLAPGQGVDVWASAVLDFMGSYKFTLAFENANCEGYISEKLWRALVAGSVPIYMGDPSAKKWMWADKIAIFVTDFESPKSLAEYINYLDRNDTAYLEYMEWKFKPLPGDSKLAQAFPHATRLGNTTIWPRMACSVCDTWRREAGQPTPSPSPPPPPGTARGSGGGPDGFDVFTTMPVLPRPPEFYQAVAYKCDAAFRRQYPFAMDMPKPRLGALPPALVAHRAAAAANASASGGSSGSAAAALEEAALKNGVARRAAAAAAADGTGAGGILSHDVDGSSRPPPPHTTAHQPAAGDHHQQHDVHRRKSVFHDDDDEEDAGRHPV